MSPNNIELASFLILVAVAAIVAYTLHKVRRIHLLQFALLREHEKTGKDAAGTYKQVESLIWLDRLLGLAQPLPPLRGWAGSPDFLLVLAEHVLSAQPKCVLECSSGASTLVIARCLQKIGSGHVYSLEHSPEYAEKTRANLKRHGLDGWATILDAPLEPQPDFNGARWYSLKNLATVAGQVDMLVIDGPPQDTAPLARLPAVPALAHVMAPTCVTFLDDSDREDETAIVARWLAQFPHLQAEQMWCEKGCVKLSSKPV